MWLHQKIEIEDRERERKYLESIGPIGRIFDSHWQFVLLLCLVWPIGFGIGLVIGLLL